MEEKITTFLTFDDQAQEAIQFYLAALCELLGDPDPEKSQRVMNAMLQMSKIEIQRLQHAYEGR